VAIASGSHRGVALGGQLLQGVLPHGLKQPVTHDARPVLGDHQRPVHQAGQRVNQVALRDAADGPYPFQAAPAREQGDPGEQPALAGPEGAVAPVDRRFEGPAPGTDKETEAVTEQALDLRDRERSGARRSQLDGQGQAVELTADASQRPRRVVKTQRWRGRRGAVDEQLHRVERQQLGQGRGAVLWRERQRRNRPHRLADDPEADSARRQHVDARAAAGQLLDQRRARAQHVLAVVEEDEGVPLRQVLDQGGARGPARHLGQPEDVQHVLGHRAVPGQPRQLRSPDPVWIGG
jgi:hypothetical protein